MKKTILSILLIIVILVCLFILVHISTPSLFIEVNEEGYLTLNHIFSKDEWYTVVWETDAGHLYNESLNEIYKSQPENGYYLYSSLEEKVRWDSKDNDGQLYDMATIRAYVFKTSKDSPYSQVENTTKIGEITIAKKQFHFSVSNKRIFGNPHREDNVNDWQQIILLHEQENYMVFRYRTGSIIGKNDVFCWETSASPFSETEISSAPFYTPSIKNDNQFIISSETVCFENSSFPLDFFDGTTYYSNENPYELTIKAFTINKNKTKGDVVDMSFAKNISELKILVQDDNFILK